MENFDDYFTVEAYLSKGWEVVSKHEYLSEAIEAYRRELNHVPVASVRLTSPTWHTK